MDSLLDILFRFPNVEGASPEFVTSVVSLFTVPAIVTDRKMDIHVANLQGQDLLLRSAAEPESRARRPGARSFPSSLAAYVKRCLKAKQAVLLDDFAVPGLCGDRCDVLLCPGDVEGQERCFVFLLPPYWIHGSAPVGPMEKLMDSIEGAAVCLDNEIRFLATNKRHLAAFGYTAEEIKGARLSELNPSKQAKVLENQIRHLVTTGQIRKSKADVISTSKRGVIVVAITGWPLIDWSDRAQGFFAVLSPTMASTPLPLVDQRAQDLFGQAAIAFGPPIFFTQLDGRIIAMNTAASILVGAPARDQNDIKTAVAWRHPEVVEELYRRMLAGSDYSAFLTDIDTPGGTRVFMVKAYGLKEVGDITSEVLVHVMDVTESEHSRKLLAETARRLATEKEMLDRVLGGLTAVKMAYAVVDRELTVLRVNDEMLEAFDVDAADFVGRKVYEIDPSTRQTGIVAYIKTAIDRGQDIRIDAFPYQLPGGRRPILAVGFYPMKFDGREACLVVAERLDERMKMEAEMHRKSTLLETLLSGVEEAVAVVDLDGLIVEVNSVITGMLGVSREQMIGRPETEFTAVEEGDLLADFKRRAMVTRQPVNTGCLKLTSKVRGAPVFVSFSYVPLFNSEGTMEAIAIIARYRTKEVNLEKQVEDYTHNLERLIGERTRELSTANAILEGTVEKLASMAKSSMVLSSLKDTESAMASFLKEAQQVLDAEFVSVALVSAGEGTSKTTYYSTGRPPPHGKIPSDLIEQSLARLALAGSTEGELNVPLDNLMLLSFAFSNYRGLFLAWKAEGKFTSIEHNLSRLLCTQLSFSLPVTTYVSDLRTERDRSQCLRRIAYRTAGCGTVRAAIRVVAEELHKALQADRFFWLVSNSRQDIWLSEIHRASGIPSGRSVHLSQEESASLTPLLKACHDSHRLFCERFPGFGREEFAPDGTSEGQVACPFVRKSDRGDLAKSLRGILRSEGLVGQNGGSLAVAPVSLSANSWGLLCAYSDTGVPISSEDTCFMCLAASTVGHMWHAVDASSSIRRLEAEGETVSELAHDLKYPLIRIRDCIANICCGKSAPEENAALEDIQSEIERLNLLTRELADISNRRDRKPEIVDVGDLVGYCISITAADAADKSVKIRRRGDDPLPPVFANPKDVKNVLINVLANCIDAAGDPGWVDITLDVDGSRAGGGFVTIVVEDSGPGVAADELERVFDPFFSTKAGGSGVGLFSAKKRANANGGDIVCEIGEDGRSRFVIWFPVASG